VVAESEFRVVREEGEDGSTGGVVWCGEATEVSSQPRAAGGQDQRGQFDERRRRREVIGVTRRRTMGSPGGGR
jgi:hypothetical protein